MERGGLEVTTLCVIWLKEGRKHYFWGEVFSDPHEVFLRERERERVFVFVLWCPHTVETMERHDQWFNANEHIVYKYMYM